VFPLSTVFPAESRPSQDLTVENFPRLLKDYSWIDSSPVVFFFVMLSVGFLSSVRSGVSTSRSLFSKFSAWRILSKYFLIFFRLLFFRHFLFFASDPLALTQGHRMDPLFPPHRFRLTASL